MWWFYCNGTPIPISAPSMNHTDYYNHKGWYSIVTQAVIDHNGLLHDLCIGWPSSIHDARILPNSKIYREIIDGCFTSRKRSPSLYSIFFNVDSAYPLVSWLIKHKYFQHHCPRLSCFCW